MITGPVPMIATTEPPEERTISHWPTLSRLVAIGVAVAFVAAPLLIAWELGRKFRFNTLLLDDWAYVPLYEKALQGTLTLHDFFGGYLEHRPAVARAIAIVATLLSKGDMRVQSVVAFVAISLSWVNCGVLLRRAIPAWRQWWIPFGILGWIMFCPVQWQEFLWPSCHMDPLPFLFLTTGLIVLGREKWPTALRLPVCVLCAWLGTYSFAAGLTLWVLIPAAAACGYGLPEPRRRIRFVALWCLPMAAVLFEYFHGLTNEMEGPFAYGQGDVDTMTHSVMAVVQHPEKGVKFLATLLGGSAARGVFGRRAEVALWMGVAGLSVFGMSLLIWMKRWGQMSARIAALPFVMFSGYGVAVAGMVASGRAWASKDVGGAMNNRYACFATVFVAGLAGLIAVLRHFSTNAGGGEPGIDGSGDAVFNGLHSPVVIRSVPVLTGLLGGLLIANWCYGAEMMQAWHYARTRGAADIHFSPLFGLSQERGGPFQHIHLAASRALTMDRLGLLHPPLEKTPSLSEFRILAPLPEQLGGIEGTNCRTTGQMTIYGYAILSQSGRPVDAVLITIEGDSQKEPLIVDVFIPDGLPAFWRRSTTKDLQYVVSNDRVPERFGEWAASIDRSKLPKGRLRIKAWALDFPGMSVRAIDDGIILDN